MNKDWTGNLYSVYKSIGATNYSNAKRECNDFYATEPKAATLLLEQEVFHEVIWECACVQGHLAKVFEQCGHHVIATDIVYRGYGIVESFDFLNNTIIDFDGDIITNPPYKYAIEFVEKALDIIKARRKVAMFLKLQFLEGKARKELFKKYPPKTVYVSSSRLICALNGKFENITSSAVAYAWFVWQKGYVDETVIKWIN